MPLGPGEEALATAEVHRPDRVAMAVEAAGHETGAGHLELPHQPGALEYFARELAAKEINITSRHATTVKGS